MNLITAKGLCKSFRGREVVKGLDLEIKEGEVVALIGPNGAGKSTTLSMLLGIQKPDNGSVTFWREDYRGHIGVQLQSTPFFEGYTAAENLQLFGALYHTFLSKEQIEEKLASCKLEKAGRIPAVKLSIGQQKRLAIAVTTVHHPDLVILDEPAAGLDPRARHDIRGMIGALKAQGRAVLFTSHDMEEVERTADRVIFMKDGRIAAQGTAEELKADNKAQSLDALYLAWTDDNGIGGVNV